MDDREVADEPLSERVRHAWQDFVLPFAQDLQRARLGHFDSPGAAAHLAIMEHRPQDPEVWAEWGRETARRHCLHDCLNVPAAIDLDNRTRILMYPEAEWRQVSQAMQQACLAELIRLWPAIYRMRLASADGLVNGALLIEVDLAGDLAELPRVGSRIAAYAAQGHHPELCCDGRFLKVSVKISA